MSLFFNGRLYVSPVTVSVVEDSAMYNKNLSVGNVLAIVGQSLGGQPDTAIRLGSPQEAADVLMGGSGLTAVQKAFAPSTQTGGPDTIVFVRVNPATPSTGSIKDASNNTLIDLSSQDYGLWTTQLRYQIAAGSINGFAVSVAYGNNYYAQDNLYRPAFAIQYTGSAATATLSVTAATATVSIASAADVVIDLTVYSTIQQLVDRLNLIDPALTATVNGNYSDNNALAGLEGLSAVDIKTAPVTVTGTLQAIIDWLNSASEGYMSATRHTNALTLPAVSAWTYLTGGVDGTVTNTQWQNAFNALQLEDVQWVVPLSPLPAIHAMADAHCQFMSTVGRKERRAIVGPAVSTSDATAIAAALNLNSDRTSYTHLGYYDYNSAGTLTLYDPYFMAALLGGMISGVNPGTALTNKAIAVRGLERNLRNPTQTDPLLLGGVLPVEKTEQGYKVVQSITTWLVNSNYNRREMSVGAAVDFMARNVRNAVDVLRGEKGSPTLLSRAASIVETALMALAKPEPMGPGVLVGDATNPPFKNITVSISGDVMSIEFQASPVIPINYIPIVIHAVPWSGSITLAA